MTKENFKKLDKTKDIYCECCQQNKPTSSFNYRNIKTNIRSANRCKTCDWFYRNHNGMDIDGARWNDSDFNEFKKVIDDEIE